MGFNEAYDKDLAALSEALGPMMKEALTEEEMAVMGKGGEDLKKAMPNPGLKVGSKAPDFTLPDSNGSKVTLSEVLKKGPVVLNFYRGSWCPVCDIHLKNLKEANSTFESKYNSTLILVTPQLTEESKGQIEKNGFTFTILSDLDYAVSKDYNLYFELSDELDAVYKKVGIDVKKTNGGDRLGLPVPATFIIDPNGTVAASQADTDYFNRMKPDEIIGALESIAKKEEVASCGCF